MDKKTFSAGMKALTDAYPDYPLKDGTIELYWEFLQRFSKTEFLAAINQHLSKNKWFPKVSELLELMREPGPHPMEVWGRLINAAEDGWQPEMDQATKAALEAIGGWEKFKVTSYDELRFLYKRFEAVYQVTRDRRLPLVGEEKKPELT